MPRANQLAPSSCLQPADSISRARAVVVYALRVCLWSETDKSVGKCGSGTLLMNSSSADLVQ